jgi:glycosyltransferase involved in cell wall biosynthesis
VTSLCIVIPTYNAEKTIEPLCYELVERYGCAFRLHIVLVNDCSRDSTHLACCRLHEHLPDVISYLRLSRNFGEHGAVMAGLHQSDEDLCVVMDDDFQNPPEEISRLLVEMEKGYDVVYSQYAAKKDHPLRNLGSLLNDKMANLVLKKPADLYLSSFKVMNRFLVEEIIKYTGADPYLDALILRTTGNLGKVEVRHDARSNGRSGYTFLKLFSLYGSMLVGCSLIPLRMIGVSGLVLMILGVYKFIAASLHHVLPLDIPSELEILSSDIAFFLGIMFIFLSILGEYVGRIYLILNSDPQFIVRERLAARNKRHSTFLPRKIHGTVCLQEAD